GGLAAVGVGRLLAATGVGRGGGAPAARAAGRRWLGVVLTLLSSPDSPVAGVFLAVAFGAWGLSARKLRLLVLGFLAVVPVLVASVLFPTGGRFPFRVGALVWTLGTIAVLALVTREQVVRIAAALYALACVAA